ncbi:MAG TPA: glycine betaine ABC transporter substrate-binding protein [Burkholderiaceae bacterium]|nr:glycine betaine ABC transporter substrate-binding protein [Burkholderiaceae bacterium]
MSPATKVLALLLGALTVVNAPAEEPLRVGSKRFTESYILGEIITRAAQGPGATAAIHLRGMGNTAILLNALESRSVDVYPEYTGTIAREILKLSEVPPLAELNARLASRGLAVAVPLGFNNSYALAVRSSDAREIGLARISDLRQHPGLRLGLSQEFLGRADGWPNLERAYRLHFPPPKGLDHGLAYEAIAGGQVDVIDIYTTDAKLDKYQLTVLADDAGFFPRYDAVLLYRADVPMRFPRAWAALARLEGALDDAAMRRLNAGAELEGKDIGAIASEWLSARQVQGRSTAAAVDSLMRPTLWQRLFAPDLGRLALEHVGLVLAALAASCAIGIPLGLLAARRRPTAPVVFGVTGVVQTIPSLALLAFLIPITGRIGVVPAFIALTLYALLPIVRNTQVGLSQIPRQMIEAAKSLGLRPATIMRRIELPLAMPTLLAGIKTSAVVSVGTATIAAFIGAGGFGDRIVAGLALNDQTMLLAGAIPVAVLALAIQGAFGLLERHVVPEGLRIRSV